MKHPPKNVGNYSKEAMATVTACHYEFGAGQALAFGIPRNKQFQISFNYWANGELHTGEFSSARAIPQGTLFPITYNPDAPHEHSHTLDAGRFRPLVALAAIGSILVLAVTILLLRGCVHLG